MGTVIYVTGAPATGKSTLCRALAFNSDFQLFCYSQRLRDHVNRETSGALDEADIRRESGKVITPRHVDEVDDLLQEEAELCRESGKHLLIDSHPVTREAYGFRVTPFKLERLLKLRPDTFICLYADPVVLTTRIEADAQGRPLPSKFELSVHVELQASVVSTYSVLTGRPCHLLNSDVDPALLMQQAQRLIGVV